VGAGLLTLTAAKRASPSIPPVAIPRRLRHWQPARPRLGRWSLRSARGRRNVNRPVDPLALSRVRTAGVQQPRPRTAAETSSWRMQLAPSPHTSAPCTIRHPVGWCGSESKSEAPHHRYKAPKLSRKLPPNTNIRRRPNMSPNDPPTRNQRSQQQSVEFHEPWHIDERGMQAGLKRRKRRHSLRAIDNAKLEPRMFAARTQGPASAQHGIPALPDRITASSYGGFMQAQAKSNSSSST
jgi:hypothetical protein